MCRFPGNQKAVNAATEFRRTDCSIANRPRRSIVLWVLRVRRLVLVYRNVVQKYGRETGTKASPRTADISCEVLNFLLVPFLVEIWISDHGSQALEDFAGTVIASLAEVANHHFDVFLAFAGPMQSLKYLREDSRIRCCKS